MPSPSLNASLNPMVEQGAGSRGPEASIAKIQNFDWKLCLQAEFSALSSVVIWIGEFLVQHYELAFKQQWILKILYKLRQSDKIVESVANKQTKTACSFAFP